MGTLVGMGLEARAIRGVQPTPGVLQIPEVQRIHAGLPTREALATLEVREILAGLQIRGGRSTRADRAGTTIGGTVVCDREPSS